MQNVKIIVNDLCTTLIDYNIIQSTSLVQGLWPQLEKKMKNRSFTHPKFVRVYNAWIINGPPHINSIAKTKFSLLHPKPCHKKAKYGGYVNYG